jgi:hypothetical protein
MELTDEEMATIRDASREIDFGRITINFTGSPSYTVDIVPEKHIRFQHSRRAEPAHVKPQPRRGSGRYGGN